MPWDLTGNSGIQPTTNFLGTRDNQPLAIRTNNVERMRVTPTGDVGIGTTNPASKLEVRGQLRTTGPLVFVDPNGIPYPDNWIGMASNIEGTTKWLHIGGITEGGVRRLTLWANRTHIWGDVGIGTPTPDAKLTIQKDEGNGQFSSRPAQIRIHGHTNPNNKLELGYDTVGNFAVIGALTEMVAWRNIILANNGGNVGIGTTAPGAKLDISGSGGANQCCAPVRPTLSLAEASSAQNRQAWLQFHNGGEAEAYIRLAGGGPAGSGREGERRLEIGDSQGVNTGLTVQGDIRLLGADCAEEFDVSSAEQIEPGTVMVIDEEGVLRESSRAYDKRVAGVVSGGGDYRAGLLLDRQESKANRMPVALVGKVACKVDARPSQIEVGDLLTTAPTPGHAMKANDASKAPGAVIGKALQRLAEGQGLIRVVVSLQ
jgi:hypothetical protein